MREQDIRRAGGEAPRVLTAATLRLVPAAAAADRRTLARLWARLPGLGADRAASPAVIIFAWVAMAPSPRRSAPLLRAIASGP